MKHLSRRIDTYKGCHCMIDATGAIRLMLWNADDKDTILTLVSEEPERVLEELMRECRRVLNSLAVKKGTEERERVP